MLEPRWPSWDWCPMLWEPTSRLEFLLIPGFIFKYIYKIIPGWKEGKQNQNKSQQKSPEGSAKAAPQIDVGTPTSLPTRFATIQKALDKRCCIGFLDATTGRLNSIALPPITPQIFKTMRLEPSSPRKSLLPTDIHSGLNRKQLLRKWWWSRLMFLLS